MGRTPTLALLPGLLALAACNSQLVRDPAFAPAYPAPAAAAPAATGAIYRPATRTALFEDQRARRVGHVLAIRLTEPTHASKSSTTTTERSQESRIENPTILGTQPRFDLPGALPLASTDDNTLESGLESDHEFEGTGDSRQSNSLSGDISVTVAEVLPNGNLYVRGEKRLNLNQGNEYVRIAGIVRPIDIGADNSVPSTRVADATIVYSGDGALADSNRPGWLTRFFNSAVFPF